MTNFLLLVAVVTLLYIAWKIPKDSARRKEERDMASKKESMFALQLPSLKGKTCEFTMKGVSAAFDYAVTGTAIVLDSDAVWVLASFETRKGPVERMFRISDVSEIRELK